MFFNKAIIIGNITRDPEIKALPSGAKVCSFSVATNRVWKDQSGARKEQSDFHNIVVFGRQAEIVSQYMKKGSMILVEGRMQTRSWDGQDGQKRYRTEIVADKVQFGPKTGGVSTGAPAVASAPAPSDDGDGIDMIEYPEDDINAEDIPF